MYVFPHVKVDESLGTMQTVLLESEGVRWVLDKGTEVAVVVDLSVVFDLGEGELVERECVVNCLLNLQGTWERVILARRRDVACCER